MVSVCFVDSATTQTWLAVAAIDLFLVTMIMSTSVHYLQQRVGLMMEKQSGKQAEAAVQVEMEKDATLLQVQSLIGSGMTLACTLPPIAFRRAPHCCVLCFNSLFLLFLQLSRLPCLLLTFPACDAIYRLCFPGPASWITSSIG